MDGNVATYPSLDRRDLLGPLDLFALLSLLDPLDLEGLWFRISDLLCHEGLSIPVGLEIPEDLERAEIYLLECSCVDLVKVGNWRKIGNESTLHISSWTVSTMTSKTTKVQTHEEKKHQEKV